MLDNTCSKKCFSGSKTLRGNILVLYQDVCTFKSVVHLNAFCKKYSADKQIKVNVQIESQQ